MLVPSSFRSEELHDFFALRGLQVAFGSSAKILPGSDHRARDRDKLLSVAGSWLGYISFLPTMWKRSTNPPPAPARFERLMSGRQGNPDSPPPEIIPHMIALKTKSV